MQQSLEEALVALGRTALVASELEGDDGSTLLCGQGQPLAGPGETWPSRSGRRLVNVLNVNTAELPSVPAFLNRAAYWSFFITPDAFEQSVSDGTLLVRPYPSVQSLRPLTPPDSLAAPVRLRFAAEVDYPLGFALAKCLPEATAFEDQYPCLSGIKLGGYPHMIQGTAFLESLDPEFQIQLDCSSHYCYGDSGIGFVYGGLSAVIWECV
jgi:hypothetical protein